MSGCVSLHQASRISRPLDFTLTICQCGQCFSRFSFFIFYAAGERPRRSADVTVCAALNSFLPNVEALQSPGKSSESGSGSKHFFISFSRLPFVPEDQNSVHVCAFRSLRCLDFVRLSLRTVIRCVFTHSILISSAQLSSRFRYTSRDRARGVLLL